MAITRTAWIDDDGTGTTGTVINNAEKTILYNQIDAAILSPSDNLNLTAGRIIFPVTQNPSSDPNALDDYEEGTFTPVFQGSGGQSGQAYGMQYGRYIKIGRLVVVNGRIILSTLGTITGTVYIGNFPFSADAPSGIHQAGSVGHFGPLAVSVAWLGGIMEPGLGQFGLTYVPAAGGTSVSDLLGTHLTSTTSVMFSVSYLHTQ